MVFKQVFLSGDTGVTGRTLSHSTKSLFTQLHQKRQTGPIPGVQGDRDLGCQQPGFKFLEHVQYQVVLRLEQLGSTAIIYSRKLYMHESSSLPHLTIS